MQLGCLCVFPVSPETHPAHGRPLFRDERSCKTLERLQKKLKDRQGGQAGGGVGGQATKDSPPLSPQKNHGTPPAAGGDLQNGLLKGIEDQSQAAALTSPGSVRETDLAGSKKYHSNITHIKYHDVLCHNIYEL